MYLAHRYYRNKLDEQTFFLFEMGLVILQLDYHRSRKSKLKQEATASLTVGRDRGNPANRLKPQCVPAVFLSALYTAGNGSV